MEDESNKQSQHCKLGQNMANFIKINRAKQDSFEMEEIDDDQNESCIEIEEINDKDKGYVSCEEKDKIFLTETDSCIIIEPKEIRLQMSPQRDQFHHEESNTFSEYPIKNLIRYFQKLLFLFFIKP